MKSILTHGGARALARSIVQQRPISFSKFRIGSSVGFTPSPRVEDVDKFVYEGSKSQINVTFGVNENIANVELALDHTVGNFDIGNVLLYDQNDTPFVYGVRESVIPKIRSTQFSLGSEISIQMPVRILTDETPAVVSTLVQKESSLPVVADETGLVALNSTQSEFPAYIVENFRESGRPAILYASSTQDKWWANPFFEDLNNPDYASISGGRIGDAYSIPIGFTLFGGSYLDQREVINIRSGGSFDDEEARIVSGGQTFEGA